MPETTKHKQPDLSEVESALQWAANSGYYRYREAAEQLGKLTGRSLVWEYGRGGRFYKWVDTPDPS